jgi:hypothetical protein
MEEGLFGIIGDDGPDDDADFIAAVERHDGGELARLSKENEDLRDALSLLYSQNKCGCGHPACNRCEDDRIAEEALGIESEKPC